MKWLPNIKENDKTRNYKTVSCMNYCQSIHVTLIYLVLSQQINSAGVVLGVGYI